MKAVVGIPDASTVIALCGGPCSNFAAVEVFLAETAGISHRCCLGDLGGFGPHPDRALDLVRASDLVCLKGTYDYAVGFDERDCGCGYLDPRLERTVADRNTRASPKPASTSPVTDARHAAAAQSN